MSECKTCSDGSVGELLAAYEMGLLSEEDRVRFEQHVVECPTCLAQLYEMAPGIVALQNAPGKLAAHMAAVSADAEAPSSVSRPSFDLAAWLRAMPGRGAGRGKASVITGCTSIRLPS